MRRCRVGGRERRDLKYITHDGVVEILTSRWRDGTRWRRERSGDDGGQEGTRKGKKSVEERRGRTRHGVIGTNIVEGKEGDSPIIKIRAKETLERQRGPRCPSRTSNLQG